MDVQELPLAVDIGDLEPNALPEPQATSVDRGEADAIDGAADAGENPPHLVAAQDGREFLLALGPRDVEHIPRPRERLLIEELDTAEGDGVGAARDLLDGAQVEEILADVLFRELVGGRMIELGQLSDGPHVGVDGAVGVAAELEILHHAVAERRHASHTILSGNG
jgi:hypothetical protein